ncbi:ThuA domain-containing protein [Brachybacterium sp. AOP25-B2-12]|uniref:ThuA domain-containing protein n=1 Tax=Brachybacterium sp. AOP25-B2-12 TaxID=3457710 RepID=UPI0040343ED4
MILSGHGRYADPWHPYQETSRLLAGIAVRAGFTTEIVTDVDAALVHARTAPLPELVIANLGRPDDPEDPDQAEAALYGLSRILSRTPVLALHSAANAFTDSRTWGPAIGGRWVPGVSGHPPRSDMTVSRASVLPGVTDGIDDFTLDDERYLGLRTFPGNHVLYTHQDENGGAAPSVWVRESDGPRCAYDALGHDARSYESEEHRLLLTQLMNWLAPASPA